MRNLARFAAVTIAGLLLSPVAPASANWGHDETAFPLAIDEIAVVADRDSGRSGLVLGLVDGTLAAGHTYTVTVAAQHDPSTRYTDTLTAEDFEQIPAYRLLGEADMPHGDYLLTVTEYAADGAIVEKSEPTTFTYRQTAHPYIGTTPGATVRAGSTVTLGWSGAFEDGAVVTQVIGFADTKTGFTQASRRDYISCDNATCPGAKPGSPRYASVTNVSLTKQFKVPARHVGDTLVIHYEAVVLNERGHSVTAPWVFTREFKVIKP